LLTGSKEAGGDGHGTYRRFDAGEGSAVSRGRRLSTAMVQRLRRQRSLLDGLCSSSCSALEAAAACSSLLLCSSAAATLCGSSSGGSSFLLRFAQRRLPPFLHVTTVVATCGDAGAPGVHETARRRRRARGPAAAARQGGDGYARGPGEGRATRPRMAQAVTLCPTRVGEVGRGNWRWPQGGGARVEGGWGTTFIGGASLGHGRRWTAVGVRRRLRDAWQHPGARVG
jgi:hypothetical protein